MIANNSKRYSQEELEEFKILILKKLDKSERQLANLDAQILEATEAMENEGDLIDNSSSSVDMGMLQAMANRQRKYVIDLRNALQRVHNKSYGICSVTGELIDKRRLMAVPTTTKSLLVKVEASQPEKKTIQSVAARPAPSTPKIISRIIRKTGVTANKPNSEIENDLDLELDDYDLDFMNRKRTIDFDSFSDEDFDG